MRSMLAAALLLSGCYCSHERVRERDGAISDASARDAGSSDAGAVVDAAPPLWEPPPGVCTPPDAQRRPRFAGDTQEARDLEAARLALFRACSVGEGCGVVRFEVAEDGRVARVFDPEGDVDEACAVEGLTPLCLPGLSGEPSAEVSVCGV